MNNMQAPRFTLRARGLALVCAILAASLAAPSAGAEEEEEDNLPDAVLFREILKGLGLRPPDGAGIDYRERSPLVVPPALTLPPPDTKTVAERNPAWPQDQDVQRRREAAAARVKARTFDNIREIREQSPLSPEELTPGRRSRPPAGSVSGSHGAPAYVGTPVSPTALGYVGGLFDSLFARDKPEYKPFTGEPPRTALIEPPPGYQTPSPTQPYGIGKRDTETRLYNPEEMR